MATARFSAVLEAIALKKEVKMTLVLQNPDDVLPSLLPMRSVRVVVLMRTEQQEIDDYNASLPPQGQQLTFDQTGFNVPAVDGADEETAEDEGDDEENLVDCPDCGNLEPARGDCKRCEGCGMIPDEQAEVAAGAESLPKDGDWTPPEPFVKPEQVDESNPPTAAGEN